MHSATVPPERVILRILQLVRQRAGQPIHRTHLVNMVYLCDYVYSQSSGTPLTGLQYTRDHFGPNALGNQIVKRAEVLEDAGLIIIDEHQNRGGSYKFLYQASPTVSDAPLDGLAERVVSDVVDQYGSVDWPGVVAAAKATAPCRSAADNEILQFPTMTEENRRVRSLLDEREIAGRYNGSRRGTGLKQLRTRYGLAR